ASRKQVEELFIMRRVDAALADPADLQRNQCAEESLRLFNVAGDVVINKEKKLAPEAIANCLDLRDDFVGWTAGLRSAEYLGDRTELTLKVASPPRFNQANRQITLVPENR